jgi:N-alpha-acetyltransferase 50
MTKVLSIDFGPITPDNVEQLRKVNVACFPILYNDGFYKDVITGGGSEGLNKFAYWNGFVVGAVCARREQLGKGRDRLYIMTLGVLAAYRGRQVGTQLIQSILDYYQEQKDSELSTVDEIALHVQVSNDDAIKFYTTRFGFVRGDMVENYYRRIDPPHCYLLYKKLR